MQVCQVLILVVITTNTKIVSGYPGEHSSYAQEYKHPEYSFSYGVKDPHTGDVKHQWEKRHGDSVQGRYSLVEPDGTIRTVHYTADEKTGFNAIVRHTGPHHHPDSKKPSSHSEIYFRTPTEKAEPEVQDESGGEVEYQYVYKDQEDVGDSNGTKYIYVYDEQEEQDDAKVVSESSPVQQYTYFYLGSKMLPATNDKLLMPQLPAKFDHDLVQIEKLAPIQITILKKQPEELDLDLLKNHKPETEIDLSLLQNHGQVEYSSANKFVESSHQFSNEELDAYLKNHKHFYGQENSYLEPVQNHFSEPEPDGGFKPVAPKKPRPSRPRPIKTGKQPHTTPGLRNYSTSRGYLKYTFPPPQHLGNFGKTRQRPYYFNKKGPILFPPNPEDKNQEGSGLQRLHQRTNRNGYPRYGNQNYHQ